MSGEAYDAQFAVASILLTFGAEAVYRSGDRLTPDLFSGSPKRVAEYVLKQAESGKFVDFATIPRWLHDPAREVMIHPAAEKSTLAHLDWHLDQLETQTLRERLDKASKLIADRLMHDDVQGLRQDALEILAHTPGEKSGMVTAKEAAMTTLAELETMITNPKGIMGFDTGWKNLNQATQGQMRKKLWVIAARPGGRKSLLAMHLANGAMKRSGAKVLIFSLEMPRQEWIQRWVSHYSGVDINQAIVEKRPWQLERIAASAGAVAKLPLAFVDKPKLTRSTLFRRIRAAAREGYNYFIVDHIGIMSLPFKDLRQELGEVSSGCKALAKELNVHITLLVQLNRRAEEAMERDIKPTVSHLAEADGPGQDCDVCIIIDNEHRLVVAKNRSGPCPTIETEERLSTFTFVEAETVEPQKTYGTRA